MICFSYKFAPLMEHTAHSHLQVDINGQELFLVDKAILSSYSGKVSKLLDKTSRAPCLKLVFPDFPGGAPSFEAIVRFCYNKGRHIGTVNPFNFCHLLSAADYMEMNKFVCGKENLCDEIDKLLQEVKYWTWHELIVALKNSQGIIKMASSPGTFDKFVDAVVARIESSCEMSPCLLTSSSDSLSSEGRSPESLRDGGFKETWWFEDVVDLNIAVIEILIRKMVSRKFSNRIVSNFLFYYQKTQFKLTSRDEGVKILKGIIDMLCSLDVQCISYKGLFRLLRVSLNLNLDELRREKLTSMIGLGLDLVSLDNLLMPSQAGKNCMFDVDIVLSLVRSFFGKGDCHVLLSRVKKVGSLVDSYLMEIAPDPYLKPSKFLAMMTALPDFARDSFDGVYHAVDLYLKVHKDNSEKQKMKVCSCLNYEKLSSEAINDLTQNPCFPAKIAAEALTYQQCKLKNLLDDGNHTAAAGITHPRWLSESLKGRSQPVVLYAKKFYRSNEKDEIEANLQGMQCRVMELENVCRGMQVQMAKMMKSRFLRHIDAQLVP